MVSQMSENIFNINEHIEIPLTIERHLEAFANHKNSTERHQILWTTWRQNKRWLSHLLEYTLPSFPTYSLHDATHAESVIHNMELILGEERIKMLSATDAFMLLHVAYIHDIGMCITESDRKEIIDSPEFLELIKKSLKSDDMQVKHFAERMLSTDCICKGFDTKKIKEWFNECHETYLAVAYFLSEYRRKEHGLVSAERLKSLVSGKESIGSGFSTSEVPLRIFFQIAECAATHSIWGFEPIMKLSYENTGYAHDSMHPRFVAVLLQVADALDIDNGRFHSLIHSFYGKMNDMSELHFQKHQSLRQLNITDKKIFISADCESQDVIRLIRNECNYLEELLKNANYRWSEIAPRNFSGCLPTLLTPHLLQNGKAIPNELINAKFNLSQDKAFRLIEGINVYNDSFPYLKEVIQNAIDATKQQVWSDYCGTKPKSEGVFRENKDSISSILPEKIRKLLPKYPIEIQLEIVALDAKTGQQLEEDKPIKDFSLCKFGVKVSVQDHGIGISSNDLREISNVGVSHSSNNCKLKEMPPVLRTTGKFGIGLQSIFQVTNSFQADTRTHFGEGYHITFSSGAGSSSGIINTTNLDEIENFPFGTQISFLISDFKQIDKKRHIETWSGENPFENGYKNQKNLKEAEELISQMIHYLNSLFGELLFPIVVIPKNKFSNRKYLPDFNENGGNIIIKKPNNHDSERIEQNKLIEKIGWAFQIDKTKEYKIFGNLGDGSLYFYDANNVRLLLWDQKNHTFASVSGNRLYKKTDSSVEGYSEDNFGIKIFYKGIATRLLRNKYDDIDIVDYIDIKDANAEQLLLINREELSKEGILYVEKIYNDILSLSRAAFEDIAYKYDDIISSSEFSCLDKLIDEGFIPSIAGDEKNNCVSKKIFLFSILAYYAAISLSGSPKCKEKECPWIKMLKIIAEFTEQNNINSWNLPVYDLEVRLKEYSKPISLPRVLSNIESYGILSARKDKDFPWDNYLIEIVVDNPNARTLDQSVLMTMKQQQNVSGMPIQMNPLIKNAELWTKLLLHWIYKITPTKSIYTLLDSMECKKDSSGNIRFKTLSMKVMSEIIMDNSSIYVLLKRIQEKANFKNAKVFSTNVFQGCKCLTIKKENLPENVCPINFIELQNRNDNNMILPFSIDFVNNFFGGYREASALLSSNDDLIKEYHRLLEEPIKLLERWYNSICHNQFEDVFVDRCKEIREKMKKLAFNEKMDLFKQLSVKITETQEQQENFFSKCQEKNADTDSEDLTSDPYFDKIVESFYWKKEGAVSLFVEQSVPSSERFNDFVEKWKISSEAQNLISFIEENAEVKLNSHQYKELFQIALEKLYFAIRETTKSDFVNKLSMKNILY